MSDNEAEETFGEEETEDAGGEEGEEEVLGEEEEKLGEEEEVEEEEVFTNRKTFERKKGGVGGLGWCYHTLTLSQGIIRWYFEVYLDEICG